MGVLCGLVSILTQMSYNTSAVSTGLCGVCAANFVIPENHGDCVVLSLLVYLSLLMFVRGKGKQ